MNEELIKIRRFLHSKPELSGEEIETARFIEKRLKETRPERLITNVGGYGIIAVYKGNKQGKSLAVRCDIDALPISERNEFQYKSTNEGKFHGCGHDGHTAIAIGLAQKIAQNREKLSGQVTLIFQPAEETGTGAKKMLDDEKMKNMQFDSIIALHNLPGYEKNALILRDENFASSSIGVKIELHGATAHAAQPMSGNNPVRAMTALIDALNCLPQMCIPIHRGALVTIIHCRLGEIAFGTTPGYAVVMATLRAHYTDDLNKMKEALKDISKGIASAYKLKLEIEWVEYFPAIKNDPQCVESIRKVGEKLNMTVIEKGYPLPWTEDFAFFTEKYQGALFGLGAGTEHPPVHNENYDFPDELLQTGVNVFWEWIITMLQG